MSSGTGGTGGGASGEAGAGGSGGMRQPDGLVCHSPERCDPGEVCTRCTNSGGSSVICVPNPDQDPAGFAAATDGCEPDAADHFAECDGPEDCPSDQYCVWGNDPQATFGGQCVTEAELPDPFRANCCFDCGALPLCILCETEADCPEVLQCVEQPGAPSGINGCRPEN